MGRLGRASPSSFLLVLLLSAWLATEVRAKSYEKFLREHWDFPPSQVPERHLYCDLLMQRRHLAGPHHCKHLNTFVHAEADRVVDVCGPEGGAATGQGDLRESAETFPLTLCRLQKGSWAPDCRYDVADGQERIVIACEEGLPVHLETEVPV